MEETTVEVRMGGANPSNMHQLDPGLHIHPLHGSKFMELYNQFSIHLLSVTPQIATPWCHFGIDHFKPCNPVVIPIRLL